MPGVGKTTVGVLLAEQLGFAFMDTDIKIQTREKRRLQQIIDSDGLTAFRRVEESAILSITACAHVIATGGSVVYSERAVRHLKSGGTICHLDADPDCLLSRIDNMDSRGIAMPPGRLYFTLFDDVTLFIFSPPTLPSPWIKSHPAKPCGRLHSILQNRYHFSV